MRTRWPSQAGPSPRRPGSVSLSGLCATFIALCLFPSTRARALPLDDPSTVGQALSQVFHQTERSVVCVTSYRPVGPSPQPADGMGRLCRLEPNRGTLWASGVVIDPSGLILTCAEAAQPGDSLEVSVFDGSRSAARFLAQDPLFGVSLLQVTSPLPLVAAPRGDATPCRRGDWLLVLSYGDGTGIPSLRLGSWDIPPSETTERAPYLRLDLTDCRGTCGGVVLDGSGILRGMIVSPRVEREADLNRRDPKGGVNILECDGAWALTVSGLDSLRARLLRGSRNRPGFLGVQADTVAEAGNGGVGARTGGSAALKVVHVLPGSPAETAGILEGDQILEIEGRPVSRLSEITRLIGNAAPGTEVRLKLLRRGVPLTLTAKLVDRSALDWMQREEQLNLLRQRQLRRSAQEIQDRLRRLEATVARYR